MPKVHTHKDASIEEEQLRELLEEAGCIDADEGAEEAEAETGDEDEAVVVVAEGEDGSDSEPEVLVVVLTPEVCSSTDLEPAIRGAVNAGIRVVGVWPAGSQGECDLPEVLKKFGASEVPWDAGKLKRVVCGDSATHETPEGKPRPAPETARNCC